MRPPPRLRTLLALILALLAAAPAAAEEGAGDPWDDPLGRDGERGDPDRGYVAPWLRLEVSARLGPPIVGAFKLGPDGVAHKEELRKDLNVSGAPSLGYDLRLDVRFFSWASLGGTYWRQRMDGHQRRVHHDGVALGTVDFAGGTRVATEVDVSLGELSLRYIWAQRRKVHLWFGLGVAWATFRVRLDDGLRDVEERTETFFAPSLTYEVVGHATERLSFFLTNGIAVSPLRFPSFVNETRIGLRIRVGLGLEVVVAVGVRNGLIADTRELFGRSVTGGHDWEKARWNTVALELGLAFTK